MVSDLEPDDADGAGNGHHRDLSKEQDKVSDAVDRCHSQHVTRDDLKRLKHGSQCRQGSVFVQTDFIQNMQRVGKIVQ